MKRIKQILLFTAGFTAVSLILILTFLPEAVVPRKFHNYIIVRNETTGHCKYVNILNKSGKRIIATADCDFRPPYITSSNSFGGGFFFFKKTFPL